MDDLLREFLTESSENLQRVEQEMVELEKRPDDEELLASIFRSMHTIKGTCGFLGLSRLEGVAHSAENVLGSLRDGELAVSDGVVSDILAAADVIREILEGLEETEEEPMGDDSEIIERLQAWIGEDGERSTESLDLLFQAAQSAAVASPAPQQIEATPDPLPAKTKPAPAPSAEQMDANVPGRKGAADRNPARSVADATLRVDVEVLDRLMNLAGELVLTRNQLNQLTQSEEDSAYLAPVQQLHRVTTDLQEAVMKTRMQPVGNAWGKLPRLIRDLSNASGKKLELTMLGAETELDRQILQAIKDPLTHMIRNSADHGVEQPADRRAAGKKESGQIVLEAFHEGGHIVIEIRDDGKGLDVEGIRRKAVERGLIGEEEAAALPEHRVFDFIFEPGFSTAQQVTAVSGRGVGMDVVRRNIEQIGGAVEVSSTLGEGTTFRIKIPLTLAIMSALIVGVRGQSFAVPQIGVLELVRVEGANEHLVEDVNGALFYRLRDHLLPLVRLDRVLGFDPSEGVPSILVCQVGASRFGLIVDAVLDTHEIVVKPVGRMVKGVRAYTGTTILGDGQVIMILDVPGIAQTTDVLSRTRKEAGMASDEDRRRSGRDASLLVFDAGTPAPRAVPLSQVARLEEFSSDQIEWVDDRWVVQYRGQLLPLLPASEEIDMRGMDPRPAIVFSDGVHPMGLAVDAIRDIVNEAATIQNESTTPGLIGSIVVAGRTTELVDIDYFLAMASGEFGSDVPPPPARRPASSKGANGGGGGPPGGEDAATHHILLVDDSPFFLNMLGPVLRSQGFDVSVSHDGRHALDRLERGEVFDAVVSDIDMPHMDGFELARRVREAGRNELPLIALTSHDADEDRSHGLEVGFDQYLRKFNQKEVVAAVHAIFEEGPEATEAPEEVLA
jgi:two-component system, chemotaxis family, sensor kinase CheA